MIWNMAQVELQFDQNFITFGLFGVRRRANEDSISLFVQHRSKRNVSKLLLRFNSRQLKLKLVSFQHRDPVSAGGSEGVS